MITEKRRRGPPKSDTPPLTSKERVKRYREKLKNAGGVEVNVSFDAEEIAALIDVRHRLNLPEHATNAETIKAMTVVLAGKTLISSSKRVSADLVTLDATLDSAVFKRWPLCLPGISTQIDLKISAGPEESWKLTW